MPNALAAADPFPIANLAAAEANAIRALAEWLATPQGQAADQPTIESWLVERGWPVSKFQAWSERIAAEQAMADPNGRDPTLILEKLNSRFERIAHRAERGNDLKHAIAATEAQAKLLRAGGFAPAAAPTVAVQINTNTAHLVTDEELAAIAARGKTSDANGAKDAELWA